MRVKRNQRRAACAYRSVSPEPPCAIDARITTRLPPSYARTVTRGLQHRAWVGRSVGEESTKEVALRLPCLNGLLSVARTVKTVEAI